MTSENRANAGPKHRDLYDYSVVLVVCALHSYFFSALGATYWIDSVVYDELARCMFESFQLDRFYENEMGAVFFSHLGPLPSLIWRFAGFLGDKQWGSFAITQHIIAIVATVYYYFSAQSLQKHWLNAACVIVFTSLPFYQSFHNALMTESITSSLLLAALGTSIRQFAERDYQGIVPYCVAIFLMANLRLHFAVAIMLMAFFGYAVNKKLTWRNASLLLLTLTVSCFSFPLYRAAFTGKFFFPSSGTNAFTIALHANPFPGESIRVRLRNVSFPDGSNALEYVENGLSNIDVAVLVARWKAGGATAERIMQSMGRAASILNSDSLTYQTKRFMLALDSTGVICHNKFLPTRLVATRGFDANLMYQHFAAHYQYMSWVMDIDYRDALDSMLCYNNARVSTSDLYQASLRLAGTLRPYVVNRPSLPHLAVRFATLPPDVYVVPGILFMVFLFCICWRLASFLAVPVLVHFTLMFIGSIGNVRYSYALIPLYFISTSWGLVQMINLFKRNRRNSKIFQ